MKLHVLAVLRNKACVLLGAHPFALTQVTPNSVARPTHTHTHTGRRSHTARLHSFRHKTQRNTLTLCGPHASATQCHMGDSLTPRTQRPSHDCFVNKFNFSERAAYLAQLQARQETVSV